MISTRIEIQRQSQGQLENREQGQHATEEPSDNLGGTKTRTGTRSRTRVEDRRRRGEK